MCCVAREFAESRGYQGTKGHERQWDELGMIGVLTYAPPPWAATKPRPGVDASAEPPAICARYAAPSSRICSVTLSR